MTVVEPARRRSPPARSPARDAAPARQADGYDIVEAGAGRPAGATATMVDGRPSAGVPLPPGPAVLVNAVTGKPIFVRPILARVARLTPLIRAA
jgi:hypothetical protein